MELKQLEYFRAIVDAGTISGAARDLHMTQPPLSYQIKMLEEELQVPLFLRGKKRITLTEAGKTLYEQAGNLLMLSDLAKREVIKSSQSATLHIGMTPSTVSMMSDHLLHFANLFGGGGAPLFSISRGKRQEREAVCIMNTSFSMVCVSGVILMVTGLLFARPILILFGASKSALVYAYPYMMIYLLGTLPSMIAVGMNPFINAPGIFCSWNAFCCNRSSCESDT